MSNSSATDGVRVLWIPASPAGKEAASADDDAKWITQHFSGRAWLAVELHRGPDDAAALERLRALGTCHGLPLVAAGDVHMHVRRRRALQDAMTAIRMGCTIAEAGKDLVPERRTPSAPHRRTRRDLPRRSARRDAAHCRAVHVRPREAPLRISARTRAGRTDRSPHICAG